MAQDKKLTNEKLSHLWESEDIKILDTKNEKYAIFSDLHLGDGGKADDFHHNEETLETALKFYKENCYNLILLGDIEEFWQFDLEQIVGRYDNTVYNKMREYGNERVYRVFGNHDYDWCSPADPVFSNSGKQKGAPEALKMRDSKGNIKILLVHGHQGNIESDKNSWLSKFLVRGIFKPVEPYAKFLGFYGHPSATKSQITKDYERIMYNWAKSQKIILICGHSHRTIFASKSYADKLEEEIAELQADNSSNRNEREKVKKNRKKIKQLKRKLQEEKVKGRKIDPTEPNKEPLPCYFNTGCGLYTDGITNIEVADDEIKLVKWHRDVTKVPRFVVYEKGRLGEYIELITSLQ
ncbi:MAG: metallophosphoesterase family protein [Candidatus Cloacimonetes bacterium]|nr:metallophosphoesterase family protein [Candidatus Cloacimonadota bacterium]